MNTGSRINIGDYVFHMIGEHSEEDIAQKVICSRVTAIHQYEREDLPGRVTATRFDLKHVDSGKTYVGEEHLLGACKTDAIEKAIAHTERDLVYLKQFLEEVRAEEPEEPGE